MPNDQQGPWPFNIDRVFAAIEKQRERLLRAARALDRTGILYAGTGDHCVANWISRIDEAAVRNPDQIEIVLRRDDLPAAAAALSLAGFENHIDEDGHSFVDGPNGKPRDGVRVLFANEQVSTAKPVIAPDVVESEPAGQFRVLSLNELVRFLLSRNRNVDSMHLRDLLDVGLIDATWTRRLPPELAARLQTLLDNPDG